jgi:hypothetical protein
MTAIHWKKGISGSFDTAADWSTGTVPGIADDVFIDAPGKYTVTLPASSPQNVNTLTISKGATLDITSGVFFVPGGTTNAGNILSESYTVLYDVNNTGTIKTAGNGYIDLEYGTNSGTIESVGNGANPTGGYFINENVSYFNNYGTIAAIGTGLNINSSGNGSDQPFMNNYGTIEAIGSGASIYINGTFNNSGKLVVMNGGQIRVAVPVIGDGSAMIGDGGNLSIYAASFAENIFFSPGASGTLTVGDGYLLGGAAPFTGVLSGFGLNDRIDLLYSVQFGANTTLTYTPNNAHTGGILYVTDGTYSTTINLAGSYSAAGFQVTNDGSGYAEITYGLSVHPVTQTVSMGGTLVENAAQGVLANDTDPNGFTLSVSGVSVGGHTVQITQNHPAVIQGSDGTLTLNADGSYTYVEWSTNIPSGGAQDVFNFTVSNGHGGTTPSTLDISVTAAPVTAAPGGGLANAVETAEAMINWQVLYHTTATPDHRPTTTPEHLTGDPNQLVEYIAQDLNPTEYQNPNSTGYTFNAAGFININGNPSNQCAILVQALDPNVGLTGSWNITTGTHFQVDLKGAATSAGFNTNLATAVGTPIATFVNGTYPGTNEHAAIFLGYGTEAGQAGFFVLDQFDLPSSQPPKLNPNNYEPAEVRFIGFNDSAAHEYYTIIPL